MARLRLTIVVLEGEGDGLAAALRALLAVADDVDGAPEGLDTEVGSHGFGGDGWSVASELVEGDA